MCGCLGVTPSCISSTAHVQACLTAGRFSVPDFAFGFYNLSHFHLGKDILVLQNGNVYMHLLVQKRNPKLVNKTRFY